MLATFAIKHLSCHNYVTKFLVCHVKNNLITGYYKKPLLCIVPIFSYASPKGAIVVVQNWSWQLEILILYGPRVCRYRAMPRDGGAVPALVASRQPTTPKTTSMSLSLTRPPHSVIVSWDPCVFLLLYGQYTHPSVTIHHGIRLAQARLNLASESRAAYETRSFRPRCSPPSRTPFLSSWL